MARGVNKVILVGNLGADPEVKYTAGGTAICTLSVATSESWKDKQTGEQQERTEWHRVKLFGRLAEIAGEYLKKGRQIYIEGSIRTDKYTDKEGVQRYSTDIIGNEMQMLGGGSEGGASSGGGGGNTTASGGAWSTARPAIRTPASDTRNLFATTLSRMTISVLATSVSYPAMKRKSPHSEGFFHSNTLLVHWGTVCGQFETR